MAITKDKISRYLFENIKLLSKKDAKFIVDIFFNEIILSLEKGEQVKLSGFGNFYLLSKNKRSVRNPKTGENITITARNVVNFKPGKKLKIIVNNIL